MQLFWGFNMFEAVLSFCVLFWIFVLVESGAQSECHCLGSRLGPYIIQSLPLPPPKLPLFFSLSFSITLSLSLSAISLNGTFVSGPADDAGDWWDGIKHVGQIGDGGYAHPSQMPKNFRPLPTHTQPGNTSFI